jgi:hypothetical protein
MSNSIQEKDWWTMFTHMSESKLNQRHNEYVDKHATNAEGYWFIQVHGTDYIKLEFKDDIGDLLIEKVAEWSRNRNTLNKIGISASDSDVIQLKKLLLGRASEFVDYCSKSKNPNAEEALWGIWDVVETKWSKKSFIAPLFYDIWGWIQLELGKKGEQQMPRTQQYERQLKEYCKVNKFSIEDIKYDSQENVKYLVKEC